MILGVYGLIGTGKTTVCQYLVEKYHFLYLQLDDLAKKLEVENHDLILELKALNEQGIDVMSQDGLQLDYHKMKAAIFENERTNNILSEIIWKYVKQATKDFINEHTNENIVVEAAILPALDLKEIDYYIYVQSKKLTKELIDQNAKIISIQNNYNKNGKKNFIINNETNIQELYQQLDLIMLNLKN